MKNNLYESIKLNEDAYSEFEGIEFEYFKDKSVEICVAIKKYFRDAGFYVYSGDGVKSHTSYFYYEPVFMVRLEPLHTNWEVDVIFDERDFSYKGLELDYKSFIDTKEIRILQKLITLGKKFKDSELLLNAIKGSKSKLEY